MDMDGTDSFGQPANYAGEDSRSLIETLAWRRRRGRRAEPDLRLEHAADRRTRKEMGADEAARREAGRGGQPAGG